jgi:hypothetical protein
MSGTHPRYRCDGGSRFGPRELPTDARLLGGGHVVRLRGEVTMDSVVGQISSTTARKTGGGRDEMPPTLPKTSDKGHHRFGVETLVSEGFLTDPRCPLKGLHTHVVLRICWCLLFPTES